jgi:hypothetical protein
VEPARLPESSADSAKFSLMQDLEIHKTRWLVRRGAQVFD